MFPIAQTRPPVEDAATAYNGAVTPDPRPRLGLGDCLHLVPFQCSVKAEGAVPTAQTSRAEIALTPLRAVPCRPAPGTTLHLVPFQCSIVASLLTAQALPRDVAVTAVRPR